MATMEVEVVSPDRALFQGEASEVYARSVEGEIGILPGHQPALLLLDVAPLRVKTPDGTEHVFAVHSGFLEIREDHLRVLADIAEPIADIDAPRAGRSRQQAEERLRKDEDDAEARSALARAELRERLAGQS